MDLVSRVVAFLLQAFQYLLFAGELTIHFSWQQLALLSSFELGNLNFYRELFLLVLDHLSWDIFLPFYHSLT